MTDSIFVEYFRANLLEQYNEDFNCDFEDINKPKQTDNTNLSIEHYSSENYIDTNAQENDNSEEEAFEDINRIIKRKKSNDEDYVPSGSEKEEEEEVENTNFTVKELMKHLNEAQKRDYDLYHSNGSMRCEVDNGIYITSSMYINRLKEYL